MDSQSEKARQYPLRMKKPLNVEVEKFQLALSNKKGKVISLNDVLEYLLIKGLSSEGFCDSFDSVA